MDDQVETRAWRACEHWLWNDTKARLDQATMTLDAGVKGWDGHVGKSNEFVEQNRKLQTPEKLFSVPFKPFLKA